MVNAVVVCVTGLLVCWGYAALLRYGPGLSAGLLGGALTQSAVIGVAQDAIGNLPGLSSGQVKTEENLVAVGYAVTYPLGTILCAMLLANVLPKLYRKDLAAESAALAAELDAPEDDPDLHESYYEVVLRAYTIQRPDIVGRTIDDFEQQQQQLGHRIYITRVRRGGRILDHDQRTVLCEGDVIALSALRGSLVDYDARTHIGGETDDVELLGYQTETLHVVASEKAHLGRTVAELRKEPFMVGVYVDKIYRSGAEFPYRLSRKYLPRIQPKTRPMMSAPPDVDSEIGTPPAVSAGTYGNVPPGAQWFMDTLGLCLFVAVVGINAGPSFTSGLSTAGWGLLVFGAVATVIPLIVGFLFGHYVQEIRFPILMGVLAGGQTTTAAIGAINEQSKSQVPTLGYTIPYAVGNVLLTIWGAVIVLLHH